MTTDKLNSIEDAKTFSSGCSAITTMERIQKDDPNWRYEVEKKARNQWVICAYDEDDEFLGYL